MSTNRLEETDGKDDHGPNINWEEFRDAVRTSWETIGEHMIVFEGYNQI